jgi:hypothetical protein
VPYWEVEETEDDNDMATFYNPTLGLSASLDALAVEGNGKRAREPEDGMSGCFMMFQRAGSCAGLLPYAT